MPWPLLLPWPFLPWPLFLPWALLPRPLLLPWPLLPWPLLLLWPNFLHWPLFLPWRFMSWPLLPLLLRGGFTEQDIISQLAKREQYKPLLTELSTPIRVTHSSPSLPLSPSSVTDSWRWSPLPFWRWHPRHPQSVATILLIRIEYLNKAKAISAELLE